MNNDEPIIEALRNPELWKIVTSTLNAERGEAWFDQDYPSRVQSDWFAFEFCDLRNVFQRFVVDHLPQARPITADDLTEIARQQLAGIATDDESISEEFQNATERLRALVIAECHPDSEIVRYGHHEIELGHWFLDREIKSVRPIRFEDIWWRDNYGLDVVATPHGETKLLGGYDFRLVGVLKGHCTQQALDRAEQWFSAKLPSIAKTVAYSTTNQERTDCVRTRFLENEEIETADLSADDQMVRPRKHSGPVEVVAPYSFLTSTDAIGRLLFAECLNALLDSYGATSDQFNRRIANAVTLLSEADRADGVAVALALCFAAIEAVVCEKPKTEKDWGIEKQIMKYVPALLRPNPIGRTNRGNVLYDLYYTRCNVIHGSRPVADLLECHDVRQIAAGVLRAAAQWRIARRSQGESPSWECFIGELNEAFVSKCALRDTPDLSDLLPSEQRRRQYQRDNDAIA